MSAKLSRWSGCGWIVAALLLTPCAVRAQVVSMAELEEHAAQHRPLVDVHRARVALGGARIERAQSSYYPTLSAGINGSLGPGRELVTLTPDKAEPQDTLLVSGSRTLDDARAYIPQARYGLTLGLRGNLYDFGRTRAAVDAARAARSSAEADGRVAEQRLRRDVRSAYVGWALAYSLAALARESVTTSELREQRTLALIEEGMRPSVDALTVAQEAADARLEAHAAEEHVLTARLDLSYVSARELPSTAVPDLTLFADPNKTAAHDAGERDDMEALERARAAALSRARMHDRAIAPVLSYDVTTGLQGQSTSLFPNYGVGVGVSSVLWDGDASNAGADEARAEASELSAQAAERQALAAHQHARAKVVTEQAEQRLKLAAAALALADKRVAQLAEGVSVDSETFALQAAAAASRLRARREMLLAQAALVQARLGLIAQ